MRAATHGFPVLEAMVEESVALLRAGARPLPRGAGRLRGRAPALRAARPCRSTWPIAEKQLADAYLELRLLPEALALFDQALAASRRCDMPDDQAWTLAQRGRALALLGQPARRGRFVRRAPPRLFAAQGNARRRGGGGAGARRAGAGRRRCRRRARRWPSRRRAASLRRQQADGAVRADVVPRACAAARAAAWSRRARCSTRRSARARELQLLPVQVRCLTGQGLAARAAGDAAAARAASSGRRAVRGPAPRAARRRDAQRVPDRPPAAVPGAAAHGARRARTRALRRGAATEVLRQLDRFRARALGERAGAGPRPRETTRPTRRACATRLNWLYRRVQRLQDDGEPSAALTDELRRTEHELLERARRAAPRGARGRPRQRAPTTHFDCRRLAGACWATTTRWSSTACSTTSCSPASSLAPACALQRHVARWGEVLEALRSARFQIETLRHGAAPVAQHLAILTERAQHAPGAACTRWCGRRWRRRWPRAGACWWCRTRSSARCRSPRCTTAQCFLGRAP